jgi:hypothetical protein
MSWVFRNDDGLELNLDEHAGGREDARINPGTLTYQGATYHVTGTYVGSRPG